MYKSVIFIFVGCLCSFGTVAADTEVSLDELNEFPNNPIKKVLYRTVTPCSDTGAVQSNDRNVIKIPTKVVADLTSKIDNAQRVNFGSSSAKIMNERCKQNGDEKGHLVAAMFHGPPAWYNLVPQHNSVNRNVKQSAKHGDKTMDQWYEAELEARNWINQGGNHWVRWTVIVEYCGDHPRPSAFKVTSEMYVGTRKSTTKGTQASVSNKLSDTFFVRCRG